MRRLFFVIVIATLLAYSPLVYGDLTTGTQSMNTEQVNTKPTTPTGELLQADNKEPVANPAQGSHTNTPSNADPLSTDNSHQKLDSTTTPSHGNTRNCGTSTGVQTPTHGNTSSFGTSTRVHTPAHGSTRSCGTRSRH
jgi:hypothetical protein